MLPAFLTGSISLSIFLLLPSSLHTSQLSSSFASSLYVSSVHPHDNETGLEHLYGHGDVVDEARSAQMKNNIRFKGYTNRLLAVSAAQSQCLDLGESVRASE